MEMLEHAHHSCPTEKCIVRSMEQHFSEADQCIDDLHTKENKGHNSGESGAHQILINSVDFLFANYWGTFQCSSILLSANVQTWAKYNL